MADTSTLEAALGDFNGEVRLRALRELAAADLPAPTPRDDVNLHMHTFFSFNVGGNHRLVITRHGTRKMAGAHGCLAL